MSAAQKLLVTAPGSEALTWEPFSPPDWSNPYAAYRQLRNDAPVHWAPEAEVFCISRHEDVTAVMKDPARFSSVGAFDAAFTGRETRVGPRDVFELLRYLARARANPLRFRPDAAPGGSEPTLLRPGPPDMLITMDPPTHDQLRATVSRGFTKRRVLAWEARVRELVSRSVEELRQADRYELMQELAIPLPVTVIGEVLGIPKERHADIKRWSDGLTTAFSGSGRRDPVGESLRLLGELSAYVRGLAEERRRNPEDDVISVLVDPRHADSLNSERLVFFVILMLFAGNETTTNLIGSTTAALLENPDQLAKVQADPTLVPALVEEGLRYEAPIQLLFRRATEDTVIAGTPIPKNSRLAVMLGSANRDERFFEDPDRFDVTRTTKGHVSLGVGIHFCLGASLARLEAQIAMGALVPELDKFKLADEPREWSDSTFLRGPRRLNLVRRS